MGRADLIRHERRKRIPNQAIQFVYRFSHSHSLSTQSYSTAQQARCEKHVMANPLDSLTGCKLLLSVPGEDTDGIKVCLCLCWLLFCFSPFEDIPDEGGNVSLMNITRNVMPMK